MNRNVVGLDSAKQVFHLFMMQDGNADSAYCPLAVIRKFNRLSLMGRL